MCPPTRRSFLATSGAVGFAGLAGCAAVDDALVDREHRYRSDADLSGGAGPWPTLAYDMRRSGHRPEPTTLPAEPTVERVAPTGPFTDHPPVVADGVVYATVDDGQTPDTRDDGEFAGFVAANDGDLLFRDARGYGQGVPTVRGKTAVLTSAGTTRAVDRRTGDVHWEYPIGTGFSAPTVVDETVYVCGERLVALDAVTGERRWTADTPRWASGATAVDGTLYVDGGRGDEHDLYALDQSNGAVQWRRELDAGTRHPPAASDAVLAFTDAAGVCRVLSRDDGSERWHHELGSGSGTAPAVAGDTVYVMDEVLDAVLAFDALTGEHRWTQRVGVTFDRRPAVGDDAVYVGGLDRKASAQTLTVLDAETGAVRREIPLDIDAETGFVLADDAVYTTGMRASHDGERRYGVFRIR